MNEAKEAGSRGARWFLRHASGRLEGGEWTTMIYSWRDALDLRLLWSPPGQTPYTDAQRTSAPSNGRSRTRQTIFGGLTRSVLESSESAALLMH